MMLAIDLSGRLCVVIGGGEVAGRKAQTLLDSGAQVRVISPEIGSTIPTLQNQNNLQVLPRAFQPGDTAGAWLVVAATGRLEVDSAIAAEVHARGGMVSVSGWPEQGNVHFPAEVRRGPITVGITTGGASPALARRLSRSLAEWVGPEYGRLAELLAELRIQLRTTGGLSQSERARLFTALVDGPLLDLLKHENDEQARFLIAQTLQSYLASETVPDAGGDRGL